MCTCNSVPPPPSLLLQLPLSMFAIVCSRAVINKHWMSVSLCMFVSHKNMNLILKQVPMANRGLISNERTNDESNGALVIQTEGIINARACCSAHCAQCTFICMMMNTRSHTHKCRLIERPLSKYIGTACNAATIVRKQHANRPTNQPASPVCIVHVYHRFIAFNSDILQLFINTIFSDWPFTK